MHTDAIPEGCYSPLTTPRKFLLASPSDMSIWHGKAQAEAMLLGLEQSSQLTANLCQTASFEGCLYLHRRQEQVPCHSRTPYMSLHLTITCVEHLRQLMQRKPSFFSFHLADSQWECAYHHGNAIPLCSGKKEEI